MFKVITTDRLSGYRTKHTFLRYGAFKTTDEFIELVECAKRLESAIYILGKGTNTLFTRQKINTAVLKNEMPEVIESFDSTPQGETVKFSSSVPIMRALRYCEARSLDSFYFLASVPGNIGGAVAMNAGGGEGSGLDIFNYLKEVSVIRNGKIETLSKESIDHGYRKTIFTGCNKTLIVSATFVFKKVTLQESPIKARLEYYRREQDTTGPSCGSVFSKYNKTIMGLLRRTGPRVFGSRYSKIIGNWITCLNGRHFGLRILIAMAIIAHKLTFNKIEFEVVRIK